MAVNNASVNDDNVNSIHSIFIYIYFSILFGILNIVNYRFLELTEQPTVGVVKCLTTGMLQKIFIWHIGSTC